MSGEETKHLRLTVEAMEREIAQLRRLLERRTGELHRENLHMRKALCRAVDRLEQGNEELRGALSQTTTDLAEETD